MSEKMIVIAFMTFCLCLACDQGSQMQQSASGGLRKVKITGTEDVARLKQAGAEIIVQESDYVVVRTDKMVTALAVPSEAIAESDLVQRLIHVFLMAPGDLDRVVNQGIDLWEVKGDTVVARAFDLYIHKLQEAGFRVEIIAQDASKWRGKP